MLTVKTMKEVTKDGLLRGCEKTWDGIQLSNRGCLVIFKFIACTSSGAISYSAHIFSKDKPLKYVEDSSITAVKKLVNKFISKKS